MKYKERHCITLPVVQFALQQYIWICEYASVSETDENQDHWYIQSCKDVGSADWVYLFTPASWKVDSCSEMC
jgi:hypothetical protein